jgi:hypothetical protein
MARQTSDIKSIDVGKSIVTLSVALKLNFVWFDPRIETWNIGKSSEFTSGSEY